MAVKAPCSFAFVPADNCGRLKATDRRMIRSHCMRGKNKKRHAHAAAYAPPLANYDLPQPTQPGQFSLSGPVPSKARYFREQLHWTAGTVDDKAGHARELQEAAETGSCLPRPSPVDMSLVKFAGELDNHSRELLFKFFIVSREITYPVDFRVDFDLSKTTWFHWLSLDVAYLQSVLLSASTIHDFMMQRPPAKTTYFHLRKTIAFLNERLSDSAVSIRDSTVAVVITLAGSADMAGDYAAAKAHLSGLKQMVRIRGGLEGFRDDTKLRIKIRRLDLSFSLNTGEHPQFFTDPISWAPKFDGQPVVHLAGGYGPSLRLQFLDDLEDDRLVAIFRDLQYFVGLLNTAPARKRRLRDTEFQNFICSIQYRLLQLQGTLDNILGESFRLGLLAFLTTFFQIPGKKVRYPYLADRFRECCRALEAEALQLEDLMLWLLIVGAISVYIPDEPWLRERWKPGLVWSEARRRLQEILWINAIHDNPGRYAFEVMSLPEVDHYCHAV